jgi:hypothetical protein
VQIRAESAVTLDGKEAAMFVPPLPFAPEEATTVGKQVMLSCNGLVVRLHASREAILVARRARQLLVVEMALDRIHRETMVKVV